MSAREIQTAVRRLVGGDQGYKTLDPVPVVGAQPGSVSVGHPGGGGTAAASSVVAFAESSYALREYWPERVAATSSDGIFVVMDEPIKTVALEGGEFATFKEPV